MARGKLGRLVLPVALAVSTFAVGGCGDDEEDDPTPDTVPQCADVASEPQCTKCEDAGSTTCAGEPTNVDAVCFYDADSDTCDEAIA